MVVRPNSSHHTGAQSLERPILSQVNEQRDRKEKSVMEPVNIQNVK